MPNYPRPCRFFVMSKLFQSKLSLYHIVPRYSCPYHSTPHYPRPYNIIPYKLFRPMIFHAKLHTAIIIMYKLFRCILFHAKLSTAISLKILFRPMLSYAKLSADISYGTIYSMPNYQYHTNYACPC